MKKILLATAISALLSGAAVAETAGGAGRDADGNVTATTIAAGAVGLAVAAAVVSNSRGTTLPINGGTTPPPLGCEGDDEINDDGFCVGTTTIVTGTGTNTYTTTATFTYAPTAQ